MNIQLIKRNFFITFFLLSIAWIVWLYEQLTGISLSIYGIIPHEIIGLRGILFSPFLHGDIYHISSNTIPFLVLMTVLLNAYDRIGILVLVLIHLLTGFCVWQFSPTNSIHIGMSGVIYGIAGFLVGSGFFRNEKTALAIAIVIILMYGGMIWGFLPQDGISWQSHFYGFLVGILLSYFFRKTKRHDEEEPTYSFEKEERDDRPFFEKHQQDSFLD